MGRKGPNRIKVQEAQWSKNEEVGLRERCGVKAASGSNTKIKEQLLTISKLHLFKLYHTF